MPIGLCERCRKAQSTFHVTAIDTDGEKSERHLCERCAVDEGLLQIQKPVMSGDVIEQFVNQSKAQGVASAVCEECGISFVEFKNQGPLGCPHDYDAFKALLHPMIERAHDGGSHHVGKTPRSTGVKRGGSTQQEITRVRRQLEEAVSAEDYKRAAALRDRIRELESQ